MDEETVRLQSRDRHRQSEAMVEAKLRLVAALEVRGAASRLGAERKG
jgi:hypothetical protein